MIDPFSLFFLTAAVTTLAIIVFFLTRAYTRLTEKFHSQEKINSELHEQLSEKPIKLLKNAHEQAQEIINQANREATEILESTKSYEDNSSQALKQNLASLEKQQEAVFSKASADMKIAY